MFCERKSGKGGTNGSTDSFATAHCGAVLSASRCGYRSIRALLAQVGWSMSGTQVQLKWRKQSLWSIPNPEYSLGIDRYSRPCQPQIYRAIIARLRSATVSYKPKRLHPIGPTELIRSAPIPRARRAKRAGPPLNISADYARESAEKSIGCEARYSYPIFINIHGKFNSLNRILRRAGIYASPR